MKKIIGILLVIVTVITLTGCGSKDDKTIIKNKYETLTSTDHVYELLELNDLDELIDSGEKAFVLFSSNQCGACVATIAHLDGMAKELDIDTIYYVDFYYLSETAKEWGSEGKYDYKGTPAVVLFEDGDFVMSYQSDKYDDGTSLVSRMYKFLSDYS